MCPAPARRSRSATVTWMRTPGLRVPNTRPSSAAPAMRTISTRASRVSCSVVRGSSTIASARAFWVGSTNRGPPRRGAVTRSIESVMIAADSGSRSPLIRVMPSGSGVRRRKRFCRSCASRSATPSASSWSRSSRARRATFSGGRSAASITSLWAASARSSAATSAEGNPSPSWIAAAAPTDTSPAPTPAATSDSHGDGASISSPTATMVRASGPDVPVTDDTNASGVRIPERCASPSCPSSSDERAFTSAASRDIPASTNRRASPQRPHPLDQLAIAHARRAPRGREPRGRSSRWWTCLHSPRRGNTSSTLEPNLWRTDRIQLRKEWTTWRSRRRRQMEPEGASSRPPAGPSPNQKTP